FDRWFLCSDNFCSKVLAIYDEQDDSPSHPHQKMNSRFAVRGISSPPSSPPVAITALPENHAMNISSNADGDIVEITSLSEPPTEGLRVISDATHALQQLPSSSSSLSRSDYGSGSGSTARYEQKRPSTGRVYPPALKTADRSPRIKHKVTLSPEVQRKSSPSEPKETSPAAGLNDPQQRMERNIARKSRITDSFFDAKERLEETFAERKTLLQQQKLIPPVAGAHPHQTVIVLSDVFVNTSIGIEISPVHDPANNARLLAVEVRQIDDEGRIAADGRIKVGDRLTEINQRPVYQMSISRARTYLHELQSCAHPTFTVDRSLETFLATGGEISHRSQTSSSSAQKKPILSALQQANTTAIGITSTVEVVKHTQGFGFTVTGRDTAKGERLFYIGTVKPGGAAFGVLRAGDRLLEVNGVSTTGLRQNDVVNSLKQLNVGETVKLLISRVGTMTDDAKALTSNTGNAKSATSDTERDGGEHETSKSEETQKRIGEEEILNLDIALNETGSAGLGVSLKARAVMKPDGTRQDCGIFIKKVLHGGAAFKDGRLRVNDQLIGIEDVDLRSMEKNSEASDAITKCLKAIGPSATSVRLRIARALESPSRESTTNVKMLIDATDDSLLTDKENVHSDISGNIPRTTIEGYGDYTEIVKKRTLNDVTRRRASSTDDYSNTCEESGSLLNEQQRRASDDELSHVDVDAFNRENPTRRSISEKRHMGISNDAGHTAALQRLKHFRQTSAPLLQSLLDGTPSLPSDTNTKNTLRGRDRNSTQMRSLRYGLSVAADPSGMLSSSLNKSIINSINSQQSRHTHLHKSRSSGSITSPRRRSMSLESMGSRKANAAGVANGSRLLLERTIGVEMNPSAKKPLPSALKRVQRSKASNYSFRQALEQNLSTEELPPPSVSDYEDIGQPPSNSYGSLPRNTSVAMKEKQQRRKSAGSSLFSRLSQKFVASRSRDSSPEKASTDAKEAEKKRLEEERKRIQERYDRLKQKQQRMEYSPALANAPIGINPPPSYFGPPQAVSFETYERSAQDDGNSNVEEEGMLIEEGEMPEDGIISVANSKFYGSMQRRSTKIKGVHSRGMDIIVTQDIPNLQSAHSIRTTATGATQVASTVMDPLTTAGQAHRPVSNNNDHEERLHTTMTTTTHSMRGSRTVAQAGIYRPPPEASLVFIPDTSKPSTRKQVEASQHVESTMKDSDRAPVKCRLQHSDAAPIPSTTMSAGRHVPVVFPTSRTFFIGSASSSAHSRRSPSLRSSSMRTRQKSTNIRPACTTRQSDSTPVHVHTSVPSSENIEPQCLRSCSTSQSNRQENRAQNQQQSLHEATAAARPTQQTQQAAQSYRPNQQQSQQRERYGSNATRSMPSLERFAPIGKSNRASADAGGVVTFIGVSPTSPVYLQTLLESPLGSPLPTRVIPIQHFPTASRPVVHAVDSTRLMQQHSEIVAHSDESVQTNEQRNSAQVDLSNFDYRKLLRPVRRDRVHERTHRVTVISGDSAIDEAFLKAATSNAAQNESIHLHAFTSGEVRKFF
uniref:PDZ domain-containing protein n=1 Tax=Parascaris univalens TaxID=6257 RepID=A0A914ZUL6_PARUN